jgi:hypothetical protein
MHKLLKNQSTGPVVYGLVCLLPALAGVHILFPDSPGYISTFAACLSAALLCCIMYYSTQTRSVKYKLWTAASIFICLLFLLFPLNEYARHKRNIGLESCEICGYFCLKRYDNTCMVCGAEKWNNSLTPLYETKLSYIRAMQLDFFCPWESGHAPDFDHLPAEDNPLGYNKDQNWKPSVTEAEVMQACQ